MMAVTPTPKTGGNGSFSIDSIMSRSSPGAEGAISVSLPSPHHYPSPQELIAASSHGHPSLSHTSDITTLRSSLHNHLLAQESAGLLNGAKPLYSQSLAAAAGASGLSGLQLANGGLAGLDSHHPALLPSGLTTLPGLADHHGLNALHALHAKSLSSPLTFGHSAASAAFSVPKHPFHLYSWLSRPAAYFAHRLPGSEPSFLLPFRKPKRIRTAFSPSQLLRLEHAFEKNHYVVGQERKDLAVNLSLTETQVKVWFQNRRTKHKRILTEDEMEERQKQHEQQKKENKESKESETLEIVN